MKDIILDPNALLGGIIYQDEEKEIVQLKLQPQNDLPVYQDQRTVLLIALSGRAEVHTDQAMSLLTPENMVLLAPNEQHKLKILTKNCHIIAIKKKSSHE